MNMEQTKPAGFAGIAVLERSEQDTLLILLYINYFTDVHSKHRTSIPNFN